MPEPEILPETESAEGGPDRSGSVRSVERAVTIVNLLAEQRIPMGVVEIAARMKLHPATAHRLMTTLVRLGWLEQDQDNASYRLGTLLTGVGATAVATSALIQHGREFLQRLAASTGFNAYLSVLVGKRVTYLARAAGEHGPDKMSDFEAGSISHPAHSMADGKLLLAFLNPREREQLYSNEVLPAYTPQTITDPEDLRRELDLIRERRYAVDRGERYEFLRGVAVPVAGSQGRTIAGLLCWARMELTPQTESWLSQEMTLISEELSHRLGIFRERRD